MSEQPVKIIISTAVMEGQTVTKQLFQFVDATTNSSLFQTYINVSYLIGPATVSAEGNDGFRGDLNNIPMPDNPGSSVVGSYFFLRQELSRPDTVCLTLTYMDSRLVDGESVPVRKIWRCRNLEIQPGGTTDSSNNYSRVTILAVAVSCAWVEDPTIDKTYDGQPFGQSDYPSTVSWYYDGIYQGEADASFEALPETNQGWAKDVGVHLISAQYTLQNNPDDYELYNPSSVIYGHITRRPITFSVLAPVMADKEYDGASLSYGMGSVIVGGMGFVAGEGANYDLTTTEESPFSKNVGTYTLSCTLNSYTPTSNTTYHDEPSFANYEITVNGSAATSTASITPKTIHVEDPTLSKTYDCHPIVLPSSASFSGRITGDSIGVTAVWPAVELIDAGSYSVTVSYELTGDEQGNYELDKTSGTATVVIDQRPLRFEVGGELSMEEWKAYDGSPLSVTLPTITPSGLAECDRVTVAIIQNPEELGKDVGVYTVSIRYEIQWGNTNPGNYAFSYPSLSSSSATGMITCKPLTIQITTPPDNDIVDRDGNIIPPYTYRGEVALGIGDIRGIVGDDDVTISVKGVLMRSRSNILAVFVTFEELGGADIGNYCIPDNYFIPIYTYPAEVTLMPFGTDLYNSSFNGAVTKTVGGESITYPESFTVCVRTLNYVLGEVGGRWGIKWDNTEKSIPPAESDGTYQYYKFDILTSPEKVGEEGDGGYRKAHICEIAYNDLVEDFTPVTAYFVSISDNGGEFYVGTYDGETHPIMTINQNVHLDSQSTVFVTLSGDGFVNYGNGWEHATGLKHAQTYELRYEQNAEWSHNNTQYYVGLYDEGEVEVGCKQLSVRSDSWVVEWNGETTISKDENVSDWVGNDGAYMKVVGTYNFPSSDLGTYANVGVSYAVVSRVSDIGDRLVSDYCIGDYVSTISASITLSPLLFEIIIDQTYHVSDDTPEYSVTYDAEPHTVEMQPKEILLSMDGYESFDISEYDVRWSVENRFDDVAETIDGVSFAKTDAATYMLFGSIKINGNYRGVGGATLVITPRPLYLSNLHVVYSG